MNDSGNGQQAVILVTGMSGAGKTTVLKALEDIGLETVDNIPLSFIPALARQGTSNGDGIAIGIDIRTRDLNLESFSLMTGELRANENLNVMVLLVDCSDSELLRRYSETRHRHPLAHDRPLIDGINLERERIAPMRQLADITIDTTGRSPGDIKSLLLAHLENRGRGKGGDRMTVFITSFAYPRGLPSEADMVFDARFLDNPHYRPELKGLTGRDAPVAEMVRNDPDFGPFMAGIEDMLARLLPRFEKEGKSYLTIAIGCTGGRHRSVLVAEELAKWLEQHGRRANLSHRELGNRS